MFTCPCLCPCQKLPIWSSSWCRAAVPLHWAFICTCADGNAMRPPQSRWRADELTICCTNWSNRHRRNHLVVGRKEVWCPTPHWRLLPQRCFHLESIGCGTSIYYAGPRFRRDPYNGQRTVSAAVSYTHLTLPTKRIV